MKLYYFVLVLFLTGTVIAQETKQDSLRIANRLTYNNSNKFTFGGYAQIDYNEPDGSTSGNLDVHRLEILLGYRFTDKLSFLTEIARRAVSGYPQLFSRQCPHPAG